jgi:hypothetical protein
MQDSGRARVLAEARRAAVLRRNLAVAVLGAAAVLAVAPAADAHDGSGRSGSNGRGGAHFPGDGRHGQERDTTPPAAPTANLPGGEVALPQTIHLSGENVRYTTDGSEPTAASTPYIAGINVTTALTIKAIAVDPAGNVSPVATFAYTERPVVREIQPAPAPVAVQPTVVVISPVREIVREVAATTVRPAAVAGIDRVTAPRRVSLSRARKGVAMSVSTRAAFMRATANRGARVTAARKAGTGYALVFTAKRTGTYKVTIAVPEASKRVVTIQVRRGGARG